MMGGVKAVAESLTASLLRAERPAFLQQSSPRVDDVCWWVVPSEGWPVYDQAKWLVRLDSNNRLWVGLSIEKGLSPEARGYIAQIPLIMGPDWAYVKMKPRVADGSFEATLDSLSSIQSVTMQLKLTNGLVPGFHPYSTAFKHVMQWQYHDRSLHLVKPVYELGALADLAQSPTIPEVWERLHRLPDERWLWASMFWGWEMEAPNRPSAANAQWERWWPALQGLLPWYASQPPS